MYPVDQKALAELLVTLGVDTAKDWDVQTMQEKVNTNGITYYLPSSGLPVLDADAKHLLGEIMERQSKNEKIEVIGDPLAYISQPLTTAEPEKVAGIEDADEVIPERNEDTESTSEPEETLQGPEAYPEPKQKRRVVKKAGVVRQNKPAKTKVHKTGKARAVQKKHRTVAGASFWDQKTGAWKKNPIIVTDRGAGVTRTIIQELEKAGKEKKPITKSKLLKVLVKAFPNRPEKKMKTTIDNLLGSKLLAQYRIAVQKTKELTKVVNKCSNCGHKVHVKRGERGYWLDGSSRQVG